LLCDSNLSSGASAGTSDETTDVDPDGQRVLASVRDFQTKYADKFLPLEFSSVTEYLFGLKLLCEMMRDVGPETALSSPAAAASASTTAASGGVAVAPVSSCPLPMSVQRHRMLVLAAAVSDYYIPPAQMAVHKLESRAGPLQLTMEQTPKALVALRHAGPMTPSSAAAPAAAAAAAWFPHGFAVSFKLETDLAVLERKARAALLGYGVNAVVANELHSRYKLVQLITRAEQQPQQLQQQQQQPSSLHSDISVQVLRRADAAASAALASSSSSSLSSLHEFDVEVDVALVRALVAEHERWIAKLDDACAK
jgi:hypothetical protein